MISISLIVYHHSISRDHYLSPDLILLSTYMADAHVRPRTEDIQTICHAHDFAARDDSEYPRKVYDLVLLSTELDWLEIRLHTVADYVDYFVIVESPTTFTGKPKPLYLKDNWDLFKDFHHKIIYRVVEDPTQSQRIWDHEDFFRDALLDSVFPNLVDTAAQANFEDVLVVSDMDEILRPETMVVLRHCRIPARLTLRTHFYYYSFQWLHQGPQWPHPDVTIYRGSATITPNDLRQGLLGKGFMINAALRRWWDRGTLWNAGWHCSSCFATVSETVTKMDSFSHQGWNTAENRDPGTLVSRVRGGKDLFGRTDQRYIRVDANADVPFYITEQNQREGKFGYLLNRDGESAGFEDYTTADSIGGSKRP
jgi:beta-1,4-mannosyl-glycoprotein beta-1,4-N-acetylglucosaminyltransferase